jgi:hypothetical protein
VSPLWLLPLGVGAAGALLLALANRRLAREVAALRAALRPLRAHPGAAGGAGRGGTATR